MMKMRQLIAATVVLAALAATLYWSNHRKPADDSVGQPAPARRTKIISLKQDDISKLEIKKKDGDDVVLNRVGSRSWKITSPKPLVADQEPVSTILYNLSPLDGATLMEEKAGRPESSSAWRTLPSQFRHGKRRQDANGSDRR